MEPYTKLIRYINLIGGINVLYQISYGYQRFFSLYFVPVPGVIIQVVRHKFFLSIVTYNLVFGLHS